MARNTEYSISITDTVISEGKEIQKNYRGNLLFDEGSNFFASIILDSGDRDIVGSVKGFIRDGVFMNLFKMYEGDNNRVADLTYNGSVWEGSYLEVKDSVPVVNKSDSRISVKLEIKD
jgi:hypothetical protein